VAATGQPLVVLDPANDPRLTAAHRAAYRRGGYRAFLGVPLTLGAQVIYRGPMNWPTTLGSTSATVACPGSWASEFS
jgi:GAF domain-containing protein